MRNMRQEKPAKDFRRETDFDRFLHFSPFSRRAFLALRADRRQSGPVLLAFLRSLCRNRTNPQIVRAALASMRGPNSMKATLIFLAVLLFAAHTATARIGETLEQCIERYGQPAVPPKPGGPVTFLKANVAITISFHEGHADMLVFFKWENGAKGPLSDEEISVLMRANSNGLSWEKTPVVTLNRAWNTADKSIYALLDAVTRSLTITTKDAIDRQKSEQASAAGKSLSGF
jgi:hypothetical protein